MYTLVIGNKTYSSWSLRPWILMKVLNIPFEEKLFPLFTPEGTAEIEKLSPSGLVPALVDSDGDISVWDSLSILEYLADNHPDKGIWPADKAARAHARSMAAEMHGGFFGIRGGCSMNLSKKYAQKDRGPDVAKDVARICALINEARSKFGGEGDFLYGGFGAVDAMYMPIVCRLNGYSIAVDDVTKAYMDTMLNLAPFNEWREAAMLEPWVIGEDEVDEEPIEVYK
ncbi:MAG: glutathione S-transferase family protein [Sphingomonadales bacterium]|nr:glutathione S-transferase family protein [Sphingomonadales bacterium]